MIEHTILSNLIFNEGFSRKSLPYIKEEYFNQADQDTFKLIKSYIDKYNVLPTKEALYIDLTNSKEFNESRYKEIGQLIESLDYDAKTSLDFLLERTEKFCRNKAITNAIMSSIRLLDGKDKQSDLGSIPQLLSDALAVSFDNSIGHDFIGDFIQRYDFYHRVENKISFDLDLFNKITKGGISRKTLTIVIAGTGVGKSLSMCHFAAGNLMNGHNVLYITMEMAEEKIAERIDANIMGITVDELMALSKEDYTSKIERIKGKTAGKLIIKEYPTSSAGSSHFRHLLNELKLKKKFVPDIIYIDYLNICSSSRMKYGSNVNTYMYIKSVAEELRGLAVEYNVPIVSATQLNREGFKNSDPGLENTSESFGLPATADMMFALIQNEDMDKLNQIMVKQLKNRYSDPNIFKRFVVGIDRPRMKLYDVEQEAQEGIVDDEPVMDKGSFDWTEDNKPFDKSKFKGFK